MLLEIKYSRKWGIFDERLTCPDVTHGVFDFIAFQVTDDKAYHISGHLRSFFEGINDFIIFAVK